ncbi:unnamed protein product [Adineta ricciae]|uniref:Microbial-type PARG catalytic domain-containing protein n=1 Tax=Adineta ricciae TaxID=249248 RepID=A0A813SJ15_ADIRI|nr:unnamed protein product [Adineta ricciae]
MGNQLCRTCPTHFTSIFTSNAPFGFQIQSSLSDPQKSPFPIGELASLRNKDKTMTLALEYLHDDQQFASVWQSDNIHPETRRWMRKLIQIQTINAVFNGFYRLSDGTKVRLDIDRMNWAAENSKLYEGYDDEYSPTQQERSYKQRAEIYVVDGDCLDTVRCFKKNRSNCNPVVLNMANAFTPGGGWRDGCGAQEENLHRRTNLFQCLEDSYNQLRDKRSWSYPIPEFGGIYSPNVSVFRGSEIDGYPFFPNGPEYISFIACAAYSYPDTKMNVYGELELYGEDTIVRTKTKIETILKIALDNNHDTVILSAFGCGAFRNPPKHIAKLFQEVIDSKYSHAFKYIIFAIIEDHNSARSHNPEGNIVPFSRVFNVPVYTIPQLESLISAHLTSAL